MKWPLSLEGVKVLVAEDNPLNMAVVRLLLRKWNMHLTEAVNGTEAVSAFRNDKFDILLIDLFMPGLDGEEVLREIRKTDKHIPVIAFTAATKDNIAIEMLQKGFTDFLQKPFMPDDLRNKIITWISGKHI